MSHDTYGPPDNDSHPYAPEPPPPGAAPPPGGEPPRRPGLPWERRHEFQPAAALLATIRDVLLEPSKAFSIMRTEGNWFEPLAFAVLVGSVGIWVALGWDMLIGTIGILSLGNASDIAAQQMATTNATRIGVAFMAPFLVAGSTFFGAAVVHLMLIVFGGAPRPYETTFRVFCYSWAVAVVNVIPICGAWVGLVWRVVVQIVGVSHAQEVPVGRAAAAVLIPLILAFCCALLLLALAFAGLAAGLGGAGF